jgi:hypothetical protein
MGPVRHLVHRVRLFVFTGSSRLGSEPKTPGWLVQDRTTSPIGDLEPAGTREAPGTLTQGAPVFPVLLPTRPATP